MGQKDHREEGEKFPAYTPGQRTTTYTEASVRVSAMCEGHKDGIANVRKKSAFKVSMATRGCSCGGGLSGEGLSKTGGNLTPPDKLGKYMRVAKRKKG